MNTGTASILGGFGVVVGFFILILLFNGNVAGGASPTATPTVPTATPTTTPIGFSPLDLNPLLFLIADASVTVDGINVELWEDQSGNGIDFAQTVTAKKPDLVASLFGSKPGIRFDSIDDNLERDDDEPIWVSTYEAGLVIVLGRRHTLPSSSQSVLSFADSGSNNQYIEHRISDSSDATIDGINQTRRHNGSTTESHTNSTPTADYGLWEWQSDTADYMLLKDNINEPVLNDDDGWWWADVADGLDKSCIACLWSNVYNHFAAIDIGVMLVFDDTVISAANRTLIRQWLFEWADNDACCDFANFQSDHVADRITYELPIDIDSRTFRALSTTALARPVEECTVLGCYYVFSGNFDSREQDVLDVILDGHGAIEGRGVRPLQQYIERRETERFDLRLSTATMDIQNRTRLDK